jgi:hypothetical protein
MLWTCPQCGAVVDASADRCWACKQPRPEPGPGAQTASIPVPEPDREPAPANEVIASASELASASRSLGTVSAPSERSAIQSWTCSKCGETVDAGFLVCWSCGTSIEGVEDPSFVRADEESLGGDESQAISFRDDHREEEKPGPAPRLCLRCQGPLEPGFIADFRAYSSVKPSEWVAGTPQPSFITGTWTGDRRFPIQALRCRHCGHLDFWAGEPVDSDAASLPNVLPDD